MKTLTLITVSTLVLAMGCHVGDEVDPLGTIQASVEENADVGDFNGNVTGTAELERSDNLEFEIEVDSGLTPGHAVTVWLCGFNNPAGCEDPDACGSCNDFGDCGAADDNSDNAEAYCQWGAGAVVDSGGNYEVEGENFSGVEALYPRAPAEDSWVLFVIRTHGPASSDPAVLDAQLNTFGGGCDVNTCEDLMAAEFRP